MKQTDFPELDFKEVHFIIPKGDHPFSSHNCQAIVVGAYYDIGITIVKKVNKKCKLFCLNKKEVSDEESYSKMFYEAIKQIKEGNVNGLIVQRTGMPEDTYGYQAKCSFE